MNKKNFSSPSIAVLESNSKNDNHSHSCPNCGSTNLATGAGLKPGQMSLKCGECKAFIGYRDVGKLQRLQKLRRQKQTTDCIDFIEQNAGLYGQAAIFLLNEVGQLGGEANG